VFDHENPYRNVSIVGHVVEVDDGERAKQHIEELSQRYRGHEYRGDMDRVLFRVAIDSIHAYGIPGP
jgi:hypothetical protein